MFCLYLSVREFLERFLKINYKYKMSCFSTNSKDITISIPRLIELDSVTYYEIMIKSANYAWTVKHRFKDFVELHEILVSERSVSVVLPPKKVSFNHSNFLFNFRLNIFFFQGNWKQKPNIFENSTNCIREIFEGCLYISASYNAEGIYRFSRFL